MKTYEQFKTGSVKSDAVWGEALVGPLPIGGTGISPFGLASTLIVNPVRRHRQRMIDQIGLTKEIAQNVNPYALGLLGAASAATLNQDNPTAHKMTLGMLGAAVAAAPTGAILASITPTWDDRKMKAYRKSKLNTVLDAVIPGFGSYHRMKTIGYLVNKKKKETEA